MRGERARLKLGMGLGGEEERMMLGLDKLNELAIRGNARDGEAAGFDFWEEGLVDFVAVAVTLDDRGGAVDLSGFGAFDEGGRVVAETHGTAGGLFAALVFHNVDDVVPRSFGSAKFFGVGGLDSAFSGGGDDGGLKAETEAEIGDLVVERVGGSGDFAFDAPGAETAGDYEAV